MQTQYSLYTTNSNEAGYRLDYMEILNWGTFNSKVFRITPGGNNSLLTGANAAGKTTFIDALTTLIVPAKKDRIYNQSSGVLKKGDRSEKTYVLGCYGNAQSEGETGISSQALRTDKDYSVLLASFRNTDFKRVTIFQLRYFSSSELKCVYGVSNQELEIQKDFSDFDSKGLWRKTLDKKYNKSNLSRKQIEFFDQIKDYSERIIKALGMRTEKAMGLFSQMTSVKVLDNLDGFFKIQMLEDRNSEEQYKKLAENFSRLTQAKTNFDKVKEQIEQLKPINEIATELEKLRKQKDHLELLRDLSVVWFSKKYISLADAEIERITEMIDVLNSEIKTYTQKQNDLNETITKINSDIDNDNVGRQIKDIEKDIKTIDKEKTRKEGKYTEYQNILKQLDIQIDVNDEQQFVEIRENAKQQRIQLENYIKKLRDEDLYSAKKEFEELDAQIERNKKSIDSLKNSSSNISGRVADIRNEIIVAVGASPDEIPFVGQLIKVKDSENVWENSIERILHNFALRLIVPEKYYEKVNEYVNGNNLRGKIVYHRYNGDEVLAGFNKTTPKSNSLANKIELKPKSKYAEWVANEIRKRFDYKCISNLQEFNSICDFAVTKEGLVKTPFGKHEKDDSQDNYKKENHVLGWDNKEKIFALTQTNKELTNKKNNQKVIVDKIKGNIELSENRKQNYFKLYDSFTKFDEINFGKCAIALSKLEKRKRELETTNDRVKALQKLRQEKTDELNQIAFEKDLRKKKLWQTEERQKSILKKQQEFKKDIITIEEKDTTVFENETNNLDSIDFENFMTQRDAYNQKSRSEITALDNTIFEKEDTIKELVIKFKRPEESIIRRFVDWYADVNQLPEDIAYITDYQKMYKKLIEEDINKYENEVNQYLQDNVKNKISEYNQFFKSWEKDINNEIRKLNESLKGINYKETINGNTYIQLECMPKPSKEVQQFKDYLRASLSNIVDLNVSRFEEVIEPFIKQLSEKEWRDRVTDVRVWFNYKASEYDRSSANIINVYEGMGHLSGGEKAQLTYTIMGAAIAYQFGITKEGMQPDSFRFIAIDEAFKAQDEEKARYLISLCKQLHLQLLVVTPSDNINIVENDISFVHFVQRKGNESIIMDMPIKQFKDEREKYLNQ